MEREERRRSGKKLRLLWSVYVCVFASFASQIIPICKRGYVMGWPKLQGDNVVKIWTVGIGFPFSHLSPTRFSMPFGFWMVAKEGCVWEG